MSRINCLSDFPILREYLRVLEWEIQSLDLSARKDFLACRVWRNHIEISTRSNGIFDEDRVIRCQDENDAIAQLRALSVTRDAQFYDDA